MRKAYGVEPKEDLGAQATAGLSAEAGVSIGCPCTAPQWVGAALSAHPPQYLSHLPSPCVISEWNEAKAIFVHKCEKRIG
jgi:hypothetical protein